MAAYGDPHKGRWLTRVWILRPLSSSYPVISSFAGENTFSARYFFLARGIVYVAAKYLAVACLSVFSGLQKYKICTLQRGPIPSVGLLLWRCVCHFISTKRKRLNNQPGIYAHGKPEAAKASDVMCY